MFFFFRKKISLINFIKHLSMLLQENGSLAASYSYKESMQAPESLSSVGFTSASK